MAQTHNDPARCGGATGPEMSLLGGCDNSENTPSTLEIQAKIIASRYRLQPHHARLVEFLAFGGGAK